MNREILFRGKRVDNGEWVYGYLLKWPVRGWKNLSTLIVPIDSMEDGMAEQVEVDADTVGQYTGICDKNGKKVFESDIVKVSIVRDYGCRDSSRIETGVIDYDSIGMIGLKIDNNVWSDCFCELELSGCITDYFFEVISNIHDNANLVTDKGEG